MKLYHKDNVGTNLFDCEVRKGGTRITFCEDYVGVEYRGNNVKLYVEDTKILEMNSGIVMYLHPDYVIDLKD